MTYIEIIKKMNRVIDSCTDKKQLPMADMYCGLLIGKFKAPEHNSIVEHFGRIRGMEDLLEHKELMMERRFQ